jgi:hypothetical protein
MTSAVLGSSAANATGHLRGDLRYVHLCDTGTARPVKCNG